MPYFDQVFWGRIWKAIQLIFGALVLLGFHQLLEYLLCLSFKKHEWLEGIVLEILLGAFLIIYFIIMLNMIFIFIPKRGTRKKVSRHVKKQTQTNT